MQRVRKGMDKMQCWRSGKAKMKNTVVENERGIFCLQPIARVSQGCKNKRSRGFPKRQSCIATPTSVTSFLLSHSLKYMCVQEKTVSASVAALGQQGIGRSFSVERKSRASLLLATRNIRRCWISSTITFDTWEQRNPTGTL